MRVLVIGATGYIGSVVAHRLAERGHDILALVQPGRSADGLPPGSEVIAGTLSDVTSLDAAARRAEAVVHLATPTGDLAVDAAATRALLEPLHGTGHPFVYTSGIWVLGATGPDAVDESAPVRPLPIVGYRPAIEQQVLSAADHGVRSVVIRPAIAHGRGGGIPALLVALAREHGVGRYVGADDTTWPMVHVDDLADLFVATLERAPAGTVLHGVDEPAVPVVDIARAAAVAAGIHGIASWPVGEASASLGEAFAEALALSQACSGRLARHLLDWSPRGADAVTDIAAGSYPGAAAA